MKKLLFISIFFLLWASFYSLKPFFAKKITKNSRALVRQKKLQNYRFNFLKRFYGTRIKTINPFVFLRKKLRKLWFDYTYRSIDLSKAHKLIESKVDISEKPILKGLDKQKIVAEITEKLQDFYNSYFLDIMTDSSLGMIERVGTMTSILVEGKYFVSEEQRKNKPLFDSIITQDVSKDILKSATFRITYDNKLHEDVEKIIKKYLTTELKNTFDNMFEDEKNEKKLKKCLHEFCADTLENMAKIEKDGNYRVKFFELLAKLQKNKVISNLNNKDEIIVLRGILQSLISILETIHVQIIPRKSVEISKETVYEAQVRVQENVEHVAKIIKELIKASWIE